MAPVAATTQSGLKTNVRPKLACTPKAAPVATSDQMITHAVIHDYTKPPYSRRGILERKVCIIADGTLKGLGDEFHRRSQGQWQLYIHERGEALSIDCETFNNSAFDDIIYITSGTAFWPTERNNMTQIMQNIDGFDVIKTCVVFLGTPEFWETTLNRPIHPQNKTFFTECTAKLSERAIRTTVISRAFMNTLVWDNGYVAEGSRRSLLARLTNVFQAFLWRSRLPSILSIMKERRRALTSSFETIITTMEKEAEDAESLFDEEK
jgi:hypothetical protein